jgi:cytosine/adenosine deaminase-related metal-dependent hydrolase
MMFPTLHNSGMPPLDIIRAVTTNAAEMLGWLDRVGAIESGNLLISLPSLETQSPTLPNWREFDS